MKIQVEKVTFNSFKAINFFKIDNISDSFKVDVIRELANNKLVDICPSNPLDYVLVNSINTYADKVHDAIIIEIDSYANHMSYFNIKNAN